MHRRKFYKNFDVNVFMEFPQQEGYFYFIEPGSSIPERIEFWLNTPRDERGVFLFPSQTQGLRYGPVFAGSKVISSIELDDERVRALATNNIDFMLSTAIETKSGGLLFPNDYRHDESPDRWFSGMSQGIVAAALVWEYRLNKRIKHLEAARRAIWAMLENDSGIALPLRKGIWLDEFPFGERRFWTARWAPWRVLRWLIVRCASTMRRTRALAMC